MWLCFGLHSSSNSKQCNTWMCNRTTIAHTEHKAQNTKKHTKHNKPGAFYTRSQQPKTSQSYMHRICARIPSNQSETKRTLPKYWNHLFHIVRSFVRSFVLHRPLSFLFVLLHKACDSMQRWKNERTKIKVLFRNAHR